MNEELQDLLRSPREDLDTELKQWMDPSDRLVQAKFANEMLALRNHSDGYPTEAHYCQYRHEIEPYEFR